MDGQNVCKSDHCNLTWAGRVGLGLLHDDGVVDRAVIRVQSSTDLPACCLAVPWCSDEGDTLQHELGDDGFLRG